MTREVEHIEQEGTRGKCQCGQFDMPSDAMKIEARGYGLHARHKCSWGRRADALDVVRLARIVADAEAELDRVERAGGDAPHTCCSLATRIRVLVTPPPKPPEPQIRAIKEGHIPPRTDGYVPWWRRWGR